MIDDSLEQAILRLVALLVIGHTSLCYLDEVAQQLDTNLKLKLARYNCWGELSEVPYIVLDIIIKATKANFVITQSPVALVQQSDTIIADCFEFSDLIITAFRAASKLKNAPKNQQGNYQRQLQRLYIAMQAYVYYA